MKDIAIAIGRTVAITVAAHYLAKAIITAEAKHREKKARKK